MGAGGRGPAGVPFRPPRCAGRSPRTPRGSARTCPASRARCAATPARWRRGVPTPPACSLFAAVDEAPLDVFVGVDAPVAKEGPVAPHVLDAGEIDLADEDLLLVRRGLGDHHAERIGDERGAPEFKALIAFVPDAVDGRDVDAVG